MKKYIILLLSCFCLFALTSCSSVDSNDKFSNYPYQAELDDNNDILILAKSEEALNDFINNIVYSEINSAFSGFEEADISESDDALTIESAEFENKDSDELFSTIYIKVRNNSGQSAILLNLNVDFVDENGDIVSSTYPQYGSVIEDGQACTMDVLFEGVPYGVRIASADITTVSDEYIDVILETPFVAINPES